MTRRILITGGAGFIGTHLAAHLLRQGHLVRILDRTPATPLPDPLLHHPGSLEWMHADLADPAAVRQALRGIDVVYHLLAPTPILNHDLLEIARSHQLGTAILLDALKDRPVHRLILRSSVDVYGQGRYRDRQGHVLTPPPRSPDDLAAARWTPRDRDDRPMAPLPTDEAAPPQPPSPSALAVHHQEQQALLLGQAYGLDVVTLRLPEVYGPSLAPSHTRDHLLNRWGHNLRHNRAPVIHEDGLQQRSFLYIADLVHALERAMTAPHLAGQVINLANRSSHALLDAARTLAQILGKTRLPLAPNHQPQPDAIRHAIPDIQRAQRLLHWQPRVSLHHGLLQCSQRRRGTPHTTP